MAQDLKTKALQYHSQGIPGKIKVIPIKPCSNAEELSLAYTPGVAYPCLEIKDRPEDAYKYTSKSNLVAVISNGTAVLGLGDIGPLAGKPVMEGKGVLFKRFADIDVFDLEINEKDPQRFVDIVTSLEPTFGGINLEDIKAPECFYIEEQLIKRLHIPVIHDDQHGTAVIISAALLNSLELVNKKIDSIKIIFSGAGAAAIAVAKMLLTIGVPKKNIFMCDSQGLITNSRADLHPSKVPFAQESDLTTLTQILSEADVFIGVSKGNLLTPQMVRSMSAKPIIFAMANPVPEISYDEAKKAVPDAIVATGRSDFPNQVNNVLGFPFLFRGALDVQATAINSEMKLAAVRAIAKLAHQKIPKKVADAYKQQFSFGPEYILPKIFDPRILPQVSVAVAKAAVESGVARKKITNWDAYTKQLQKLALRLSKNKF